MNPPALSRRRLLRLALAVSLAPVVPGGSAQGPCQLFPGKLVKAAGWCTGWAPQM